MLSASFAARHTTSPCHTIPSVLRTSMPWGRGLRKIKSAMKTCGIGDCGGGAKRWLIRTLSSVPSLFSPCCWVPTIKKLKQVAGAASLPSSPIPAPPRGYGRLPRPDSSTMHAARTHTPCRALRARWVPERDRVAGRRVGAVPPLFKYVVPAVLSICS
ncbi:hypothetical protein B0H14DRAFT_1239985 [Mycena olivaceomarginata]|nr:hypothetical protein B0H14DRAFT_1239985 [Mycena olivaceomarginata]